MNLNIVFLLQSVILLVLNKGTTTALKSEHSFKDVASLTTYLKNQSMIAQKNITSFSPQQITVGNRTIQTLAGVPSSRMAGNDIALIFHKNGTISTYNVNGDRKELLLSARAGEFQIDDEIFGLVFPGFSQDMKGLSGNNSTIAPTTNKEMEELKESTPSTPSTTAKTLPQTGSKNSAGLRNVNVFTTLVLAFLGKTFL
eukprot:GFUD01037299.1.p1 GENE.GFUD01037299.1~~GFUD01037299.1.p1  ORF type:complete len:199 (+),score=43.86 GFUD01037299.1:319-915(+)